MGTMQLNIDPICTLLSPQTVTTSATSIAKDYSMFTIIGVVVNVSNAVGLTCSIKLQVSIDGVNYGDYAGSAITATSNAVEPYNVTDFAFNFIRVVITVSAGSATFGVVSIGKQG